MSYDGGNVMVIRRCVSLKELDAFGLKLANKGHQWTHRERSEFETRVRELKLVHSLVNKGFASAMGMG